MLAFDFGLSGWLAVGFAYAWALATTFVVLVLIGLVRLALRATGRIDPAQLGLGTIVAVLCAGCSPGTRHARNDGQAPHRPTACDSRSRRGCAMMEGVTNLVAIADRLTGAVRVLVGVPVVA